MPTAAEDEEMGQHRKRVRGAGQTMEGQTTPLQPPPGTPAQSYRRSYIPVEPDGGLASLPGALNFLAGTWLLLSPSVLDYGAGSAADENDLIVGAAIALLALVMAVVPRSLHALSGVTLVLGAWLVVAPFLMAHDALDATTNSVIVGLAVIVVSAISIGAAIRRQRAHDFARRARKVADQAG
jgi:hypothetical protein